VKRNKKIACYKADGTGEKWCMYQDGSICHKGTQVCTSSEEAPRPRPKDIEKIDRKLRKWNKKHFKCAAQMENAKKKDQYWENPWICDDYGNKVYQEA